MGDRKNATFDNAGTKQCQAMAKEARISKMWINYEKEWYTPDEFLIEIEASKLISDPYKTRFIEHKLKIRDPRGIVIRMQNHIDQLIEKKKEFEKKVNDFYK